MPISQSEALFSLVKSLSKAEKRNFKMYAKRIQGELEELKFIKLFEILDQLKTYEEQEVIAQLKNISSGQLTNLRRHLYQHICTSLRLTNIKKRKDIQIREWIDYAHLLYGKGLYIQALKILKKAKSLAKGHNQDILHLEILEFEKLIEFRHITRSLQGNTLTLTEKAFDRSQIISRSIQFSNLALQLQGYYIKHGPLRKAADEESIQKFIQTLFPDYHWGSLTFFEKIHLWQAQYWQHIILVNFKQAIQVLDASKSYFQQKPQMLYEDKDFFLKLLHQQNNLAFILNQQKCIQQNIELLKELKEKYKPYFNPNSNLHATLYLYFAKLNLYLLNRAYLKGIGFIPQVEGFISKHQHLLDPHRIMIFYYKFAALQLGAGQAALAIPFLNEIMNSKQPQLREDIQVFSRLLFLMAHYDLKNYDVIVYLIRRFQRFFSKLSSIDTFQTIVFSFFKKIPSLNQQQKTDALLALLDELNTLNQDKYILRSSRYLDVEEWISNKLKKT